MSELSAADLAAVTKDTGDFGGSSAWVLVILFALIFGWGNNGFSGSRENYATPADIQRAVDNSAIQQDIQRTAYENMAVTKDASYNNLSEIRDLESAVNAGFAAQATGLCDAKSMLLENRYLAAQEAAQTRAEAQVQTQRILDRMAEKEQQDLRDANMRLYFDKQMESVPRVSNIGYGVVPNFPAPAPQPYPFGNL